MWSLKQRNDGSIYLTYDRDRFFSRHLRGRWELVGPQNNVYTDYCVRVNSEQGLLTASDDEGNVRVLVLEN